VAFVGDFGAVSLVVGVDVFHELGSADSVLLVEEVLQV
jgi:hypothetical protein